MTPRFRGRGAGDATHEGLLNRLPGLFWGVWHLPMWVAWSKKDLSWLSLAITIHDMVPVAVLFTWLYNKTSQSLLLVCIIHASMATKGYLMPGLPTLTESAILGLGAIAVVGFGGIEISKAKAERGPSPDEE